MIISESQGVSCWEEKRTQHYPAGYPCGKAGSDNPLVVGCCVLAGKIGRRPGIDRSGMACSIEAVGIFMWCGSPEIWPFEKWFGTRKPCLACF